MGDDVDWQDVSSYGPEGDTPEVGPEIFTEELNEFRKDEAHAEAQLQIKDEAEINWTLRAKEILEVTWDDKRKRAIIIGSGITVIASIAAIIYARRNVRFKARPD